MKVKLTMFTTILSIHLLLVFLATKSNLLEETPLEMIGATIYLPGWFLASCFNLPLIENEAGGWFSNLNTLGYTISIFFWISFYWLFTLLFCKLRK